MSMDEWQARLSVIKEKQDHSLFSWLSRSLIDVRHQLTWLMSHRSNHRIITLWLKPISCKMYCNDLINWHQLMWLMWTMSLSEFCCNCPQKIRSLPHAWGSWVATSPQDIKWHLSCVSIQYSITRFKPNLPVAMRFCHAWWD